MYRARRPRRAASSIWLFAPPRARFAAVTVPPVVNLSESERHITPVFYPDQEPVEAQDAYWRKIPKWKDVASDKFLSHKWQMSNTVQSEKALCEFLAAILPADMPPQTDMAAHLRITNIGTPQQFIDRVKKGIRTAPMAVRLSPHIMSSINWRDPINDPIRRQFIPLASPLSVDHPVAELDPMKENDYSPISGLIHRYPDRALFLATSICPVYCRFCFRSYTVGAETDSVKKQRFLPIAKKWEPRFQYIEQTPALKDIVVSGGDTYLLEPEQLEYIGDRLLRIPHVRRFRFATKGLSVSPSRLLDPQDDWVGTVIRLEKKARKMGKHVCVHTHFNSVNEISWITRKGAQRLYEAGVTVRNQTVLLNGVNNTAEKMYRLVHALGDINIQPYYVYQGDIVPGAEDLRTPMSDSLNLERAVRGQIAGSLMPNFILDLPAEGGKRLTRGVESYDRRIGLSKLTAPGLKGESTTMHYWDPLWSLSEDGRAEVLEKFRRDARKSGVAPQ
ncbi:hypothetical protein HIM_03860 [Hirsutella minnesotensis 3608]|uniref:L-lysine 2,3-aminomutase n=1 Tax=Hirsutella minnesotensis 3608 TaxID=1043627 RepID=A0A0F7ZVP7_9HYPO|nr:hypothetical protein HIM_03860 [Hirsutella minnesotensis 3608]